jgi:DNA repair ATPase RecN
MERRIVIKRLEIKNVQSWESASLVLHEGLNVIIGATDGGKSAIKRAFKWATENRPLGGDLLSKWGGDSSVMVDLEEDIAITRLCTKSGDHSYTITYADGEEQVFKAIGRKPPPAEVLEALNLTSLNRQEQMEGPFLLASSPGEVARYLNRVVDLEEIDTGLINIARTLREHEGELEHNLRALDDLEEEIKKYDWISNAEMYLVNLEIDAETLFKAKDDYRHLKDMIWAIEVKTEQLTNEKQLLKSNSQVEDMLNLLAEIDDTTEEYTDLDFTRQNIVAKEAIVKEGKALLEAGSKVTELFALGDALGDAKQSYDALALLETKIDAKERVYQRLTKELDDLESEYHELMPDVCPLCGQEISK